MGSKHIKVPSPGVAVLIGFTAQAKPVRFESAGASALHTLPFGLNPGDVAGSQGRAEYTAIFWTIFSVFNLLPSPGIPNEGVGN